MPDQVREPKEIKNATKIILLEIIRSLSFLILLNKRHEKCASGKFIG